MAFRTFLIIAAILLGIGSALLTRAVPARIDMKPLLRIIVGLGAFFIFFFTAVRFVDNYTLWTLPAAVFISVLYYGFTRLGDIHQLTKPPKEKAVHSIDFDTDIQWAELEEPVDEPAQPRRFMDDFAIADEADLGPHELELERLDDFVFTSRHGYLIHNRRSDDGICDVKTILPGMSIADLIDYARQHTCAETPAANLEK